MVFLVILAFAIVLLIGIILINSLRKPKVDENGSTIMALTLENPTKDDIREYALQHNCATVTYFLELKAEGVWFKCVARIVNNTDIMVTVGSEPEVRWDLQKQTASKLLQKRVKTTV